MDRRQIHPQMGRKERVGPTQKVGESKADLDDGDKGNAMGAGVRTLVRGEGNFFCDVDENVEVGRRGRLRWR